MPTSICESVREHPRITSYNVCYTKLLRQAGFIHIGSNDGNFYTISQFGDPRNFKDEDKSSGKLLTVEDLSSGAEVVEVNNTDDWLNGKPGVKGPFAVRLEVDRGLAPNADGEFNYELRLWIRQCNNDFPCVV